MDEFDDESYEKELRRCNKLSAEGINYYAPYRFARLRLYEEEENRDLTSMGTRAMYKKLGTPLGSDDHHDFSFEQMMYSPHRVRRFFHTVKGFHMGQLDLMGRFEPRYRDLISRWNIFSAQLCTIKSHYSQQEPASDDKYRQPLINPSDGEPSINNIPLELLESFCSRWHLRLSTIDTDLDGFFENHDDVLTCLKHNPEPKFQRRRFLDLPAELIHHVMSFLCEKECRQLGLCSRMLREVSISYVYEDLSFELRIYAADIADFAALQSDDEKVLYMSKIFDSVIDKLSQRIAAIIDIASAPQRMRKLMLANSIVIREPTFSHIGIAEDFRQRLIPLTALVDKLFSRARNIETLNIFHFSLEEDSIAAILTLPRLHTINLGCTLGMKTLSHLHCDSLLNAKFSPAGQNYDTTWRILPSFPSLRCLTIVNHHTAAALPPAEVYEKANTFATLERLMIGNLHRHESEDFARWVRQAVPPNGAGLRLTHLKLELRHGLREEETRTIISALHGAPMENFVLDGLAYAEPELFDLISDAFPHLRVLTLYYRGSNRQVEGKEALWPHASWEYAPRFANFTHLRRFRWNWRLDEWTPSPSAMLLFENDFPERWQEVAECALERFTDEWESIPRLIGTHCPALQCFEFLSPDRTSAQRYLLQHNPGAGVQVKEWNFFTKPEGLTLLDVEPFQWSGWPEFSPPRKQS